MVAPPARPGAFDAEVLPQLDLLYRLALRYAGGDRSQAEDLVQETMLKAFRAWHSYQAGTSARAWLVAILRNTFLNSLRRKRRETPASELSPEALGSVHARVAQADPEAEFFDRLVDDQVQAALDRLPTEFREVVQLSDVEGLPYAEIATALAIPVGTVKSRLFRARRLLQTDLYQHALETGILRQGDRA